MNVNLGNIRGRNSLEKFSNHSPTKNKSPYSQTTRNTSREMQHSPENLRNSLVSAKSQQMLGERKGKIEDRLIKYGKQKESNVQKNKENAEKKLLEFCTFKPQINSTKKISSPGTAIYENLYLESKKKEENIKKLEKKYEKTYEFHPQINKKSQELAGNRDPIYKKSIVVTPRKTSQEDLSTNRIASSERKQLTDDFLKRNFQVIKNKEKKKAKIQQPQYPFKPCIGKNSQKILGSSALYKDLNFCERTDIYLIKKQEQQLNKSAIGKSDIKKEKFLSRTRENSANKVSASSSYIILYEKQKLAEINSPHTSPRLETLERLKKRKENIYKPFKKSIEIDDATSDLPTDSVSFQNNQENLDEENQEEQASIPFFTNLKKINVDTDLQ